MWTCGPLICRRVPVISVWSDSCVGPMRTPVGEGSIGTANAKDIEENICRLGQKERGEWQLTDFRNAAFVSSSILLHSSPISYFILNSTEHTHYVLILLVVIRPTSSSLCVYNDTPTETFAGSSIFVHFFNYSISKTELLAA